jgi:predicted nucleic acid-binding Zn ribbon protein
MQCPNCGRHIQEESAVCQFCGQHFEEEKKGTRNRIIAGFLIVVVGLSLFHFLQYETENADILVRAAAVEMQRGTELLQEAERAFYSLREVQVEATEHVHSEIVYADQSQERVKHILQNLDDALTYLERAEKFFSMCEDLALPGWYHHYVDLELQIVQEYKEYDHLLKEAAQNCDTYYEFAQYYLAGEQQLIDLLADMDRGNDNLEQEEYRFAVAAYESAVGHLVQAQKAYVKASKIIDLPYVDDFLSNLDSLEKALSDLSEAAHQLELGNVENAAFLAALGITEVESAMTINKLQLKIQAAQWYKTHISIYITEIEQVKSEIEELEKEADRTRK